MLAIPTDMLKKVNKMIFNFLWGKRDKIRRTSIISTQENGGLCMVDLESRFQSAKASWVGRIYNAKEESHWSFLSKFYFNQLGEHFLALKMTFNSSDTAPFVNSLPMFYREVLIAFNKAKKSIKIISKSDLFNHLLWGNRNFTVQKKCLYNKPYIDEGLLFVRDTILPDGRIKPSIYNNLNDKRHYFRDMTLIIKSILPYKTLRYKQEHVEQVTELHNFEIQKSNVFNKELVVQKQLLPKCTSYWSHQFNIIFDINQFYMRKLKPLQDIKVKEFVFKILHNICVCNYLLHKWKISQTAKCIYCEHNVHNIKHMLWECNQVRPLWNRVENILHLTLSYGDVILGVENEMTNIIISTICYCIYKKFLSDRERLTDQNICLIYVKSELKRRCNLYLHTKLKNSLSTALLYFTNQL